MEDVANLVLVVPVSVRDELGRLAAQRSRATDQPVSIAALLREALREHLKIAVPTASHHRRALRHRP